MECDERTWVTQRSWVISLTAPPLIRPSCSSRVARPGEGPRVSVGGIANDQLPDPQLQGSCFSSRALGLVFVVRFFPASSRAVLCSGHVTVGHGARVCGV